MKVKRPRYHPFRIAAPLAAALLLLSPGCSKYVPPQASLEAPRLPEIRHFIKVPLTRQATDYTCGLAALQSILGYYGLDYREDQLARSLRPNPEEGTKVPRIVDFLRSLDFLVEVRTGMSLADLKHLMDERIPVIVLLQAWPESPVDYKEDWKDGHYAVAVGYDPQNIYFMDPSTLGNYTFIPAGEFLDRWHDRDGDTILNQFGMIIRRRAAGELYDPDQMKYLK